MATDADARAASGRAGGERVADRLVLEIGRHRYEATRCGMIACSSCLSWDEMSEESRAGWANDWLAPHIRAAVATVLGDSATDAAHLSTEAPDAN